MITRSLMLLLCFVNILEMFPERGTLLKRDYYRHRLYDETLSNSERVNYRDSLLSLQLELNFIDYVEIGRLLTREGKYTECRDLFKNQLAILSSDSLRQRFHCMTQISANDFRLRNYSSSVEYDYQLLKSHKPDSLLIYDVFACSALRDYYRTIKKWNLVEKYHEYAQEVLASLTPNNIISAKGIEELKIELALNRVSNYIQKNEFDSAYLALQPINVDALSTDFKEMSYNLSAIIAHERKEWELAEYYYKQAIALDTRNFNRCCNLIGYGQLLLDQENTADYRKLWNENQTEIAIIMHSPLERGYLENEARYYHLMGDFAAEADTHRRITELADSLYTGVLEVSVDALVNKYEFADMEDNVAEANSHQRKFTAWIVVLSILVAILLGGALGLWIRDRRRVRELLMLEEEKDEIGRIHAAEIERTRQSLELRSRELSSMTMNMATLNEALDSIRNDAVGGEGTDKERLARIAKVIKELERQDNIWEMFKTYFDTIHNSFSRKLFELHPDLTNAELRMCAFILMDLTTKEIATLTNRSARTVEVIKYNLRKKLAVEEPTSTYLKRLALL